MTAKPDPPPLHPAPAELAALAAACRPDLAENTEEAVRLLIAGATTAGVGWAWIMRAVAWELTDTAATLRDLQNHVYAGAPGKQPR